jgi:hypothetical protein
MPPCRVVDTRDSHQAGRLRSAVRLGGETRSFAIPNGPCGIPAAAQAYSLNVTVVPHGELGYLTVWPTGQSQPLVIDAEFARWRSASQCGDCARRGAGAPSAYMRQTTRMWFWISTATSCQTRVPNGLGFLSDDALPAGGHAAGCSLHHHNRSFDRWGPARTLPILSSSCNVPATAQAYSLNFTLVPPGPVNYLTVYPTGESLPIVSTMNDPTGTVQANAAIAPAGSGGSIEAYVTQTTDLVVDINGYFAPVGAGGVVAVSAAALSSAGHAQPCGFAAVRGNH